MKRSVALCAVALAGLGVTAVSRATVLAGPGVDLRAVFDPSGPGGTAIWITGGSSPQAPIHDTVITMWHNTSLRALPIGGVAYIGDSPDGTSYTVTTIYGDDPDPSNPTLSLVGQSDPIDFDIPDGENIVGSSGTVYHSGPEAMVTLSQLAANLPGYDLSPFAGSSPDGEFLEFTTSVPVSEITLPEPASLTLLAGGFAAFGARRRRAAR
jgi:hypothetical protein